MLFYHASDRDIKRPNPLVLQQVSREWPVVPAFYANSLTCLDDYGKNLYSFNLSEDTTYLQMSYKMYVGIKNTNEYKSGLYDMAKRAGVDALWRTHSGGDTSLIVLNFNKIENWQLTSTSG